ncbi:hypothetical protein HXX76_002840 [Chlamydomonas incerta]|uniref:Uncharacterized protein n=1 Tax=Chlamydomonas incerta TaxID=51695 RepID=A0A835TLG6_CHLIN|nr:hypothetical protein HXX76_002840 [Chlamydomonas incerta]|eukprot:KAG2442759.1 hypothetical protein HXX76_002840 [Chlamydomonas incerta]
MAQLFGINFNVPLPDLHCLDPARVLAQLASSGSTMTKSLDDLLQRRLTGPAATSSGSRDSGAIIRHRTSLASAGLRAVDMKASVLGFVSLGGLIATTAQAALSPRGPGTCDRNMCERCCNVATSTPYIACGCHALKYRKTASGKAWGASVVAAGAASMVFHSSYGSFREWGRRLDFWTIAGASNIMTCALFPGVPKAVTAAGMLATPFKPFLVSFVNSVAMELKFLAAAQRNPELRRPQLLHSACCLAGLAAFALEDWRPDLPLVHSTWHLLSSVSVATLNHLMHDVEQQQLGLGVHAPTAAGAAAGALGAGVATAGGALRAHRLQEGRRHRRRNSQEELDRERARQRQHQRAHQNQHAHLHQRRLSMGFVEAAAGGGGGSATGMAGLRQGLGRLSCGDFGGAKHEPQLLVMTMQPLAA